MDDLLVSGAVAGLAAAVIRLVVSWITHLAGAQPTAISHVYGLLFIGSAATPGQVVGSVGFVAAGLAYGAVLAQFFAWYGFRYWWLKGAGFGAAAWPFSHLDARRLYVGLRPEPPAVGALSSLAGFVLAGLVASWVLLCYARWPRLRRD